MANEMVRFTGLNLPEVQTFANHFAQSGLFTDIKGAAQAFVKIQAGQELGIAPFAALSGLHIIKGKVGIGAGVISAKIKSSGKYDFKTRELSSEKCRLEFFERNSCGEMESAGFYEFTKEDAAKAGTQNMSKHPKNMLFARAVSDGYKFYCPDVFMSSVYTPEELGAVQTEDGGYAMVDGSEIGGGQGEAPVILKTEDLEPKYLKMINEATTVEQLSDFKAGGIPKDGWSPAVIEAATEKFKELRNAPKPDFKEAIVNAIVETGAGVKDGETGNVVNSETGEVIATPEYDELAGL